jgi:hypothetical protein
MHRAFDVEYLDAHSFHQELAPLAVDINRPDLLNFFADVKIPDGDGYPAYVRVGRQEILLGSERLLSPIDWANPTGHSRADTLSDRTRNSTSKCPG